MKNRECTYEREMKMKMKMVLSCLLALVLALSITPSVFADETVDGRTIYVDAINGDDTQEGVGTTSDTAYKTVAAAVAAANRVTLSSWVKATTHCMVFPVKDIPRVKT